MANQFEFTVDEINLTLKGLSFLPYNESHVLIARIVNEFQAQQQMAATADSLQAVAADPANLVPATPANNRKARRANAARK